MHVRQIIEVLGKIAPLDYAAGWDNVGLLIGSPGWEASTLLLTIDLTDQVLAEAIEGGAEMIVSYHPPIFEGLRKLVDDSPSQRIALNAARGGVAVYSPHTALDAAPDGVNDWLAKGLGQGDVRALEALQTLAETQQCKLVTFCPAEAVDRLRRALAAVGAGWIGDYSLCSFEIPGTGTFLGGETTHPQVGRKGSLQRVDEIRLEMVCPEASLAQALAAIRTTHPYEEPPIEIYRLRPHPQWAIGQGRRIELDEKADLPTLIGRIKKHLGVETLRVAPGRWELGEAGGRGVTRRYESIGVCAGAGGSLIKAAISAGCELFVTGEMRHHDILAAQAQGCTVLLGGHTNTERGYLKVLRTRLADALPDATVLVSRTDGDPLRAM